MKTVKLTDPQSVSKAIEALEKGGLVIYPTETLYGIGADATNEKAVRKLTKFKNRSFGKPYSIAVSDIVMAKNFAAVNKTATYLYQKFLPGPITVISKGKHNLAPGVESETGSLGIRIPDHQFVQDLLQKFGKPITATSANASYKKRPYKISDILENITKEQEDLIDLIVDAGELPRNEPSTVIDTTLDDPVILRQGEIRLSERQEVLSRSEENTENVAKELFQKYEPNIGKRSLIFALEGEMGSGKTTFTKGLGKAMGIKDLITSPTFALENEYQEGETELYHFDTWRMLESSELKALGFESLIKNRKIISIEWADKVADFIREFDDEAIIIWVKIAYSKKDTERLISWGII
jgi:L-threonylcarbamoyladenylate synthase